MNWKLLWEIRKPIIFSIVSLILALLLFTPIPLNYKFAIMALYPFFIVFQIMFVLDGFYKWTVDGFELQSKALHAISDGLIGYGNILQELAQVVKIEPTLLAKLKEKNPSFSFNTINETNIKVEDLDNFNKKLAEMEKKVSDFHIAKLSIGIGVSVGVALFVLAIIFLRIPLPK